MIKLKNIQFLMILKLSGHTISTSTDLSNKWDSDARPLMATILDQFIHGHKHSN